MLDRIKKFFHKRDLREVCREKYGDDFVNLYDKLGTGEPIGNLSETLVILAMIDDARKEC